MNFLQLYSIHFCLARIYNKQNPTSIIILVVYFSCKDPLPPNDYHQGMCHLQESHICLFDKMGVLCNVQILLRITIKKE